MMARRRIDGYGVARAALWAVVTLAIFLVLAVPCYVALQIALTVAGVTP